MSPFSAIVVGPVTLSGSRMVDPHERVAGRGAQRERVARGRAVAQRTRRCENGGEAAARLAEQWRACATLPRTARIAVATVVRHGTRRPAPHHGDHRRRTAQRRLLRSRARPAARQEDRELRPARRLPPLLRRRARDARRDPDVLRVPRRRAGPPRRRAWPTGSPGASPATARWTSGRSGWATRASRSRAPTDGSVRFADPEGLEHELVVDDVPDAPLARRRRRRPRRARAAGVRRACAPTGRGPPRAPTLLGALGFEGATRSWELAGDERRARYATTTPPGPRRAGRRLDPPRRLVGRRRRRARRASARSRRPRAPGRRRSSTASTSTPSTSASRAACSSSSRRATSASTSTSRCDVARRGAHAAAAARGAPRAARAAPDADHQPAAGAT